MESGPCALPLSEPCQARKGAALRRITVSAAGRLGSLRGSFYVERADRESAEDCCGLRLATGQW